MTGLLACLFGGHRWALAALVTAVTAAAVSFASMPITPLGSVYFVAILLCLGAALTKQRGGYPAMVYAPFGWTFLLLCMPPDEASLGAIFILYGIGGIWGVFVAWHLGVANLMARPTVMLNAPSFVGVTTITTGFLVTLALADLVEISRPYWIPFVYLQVVATTNLTQTGTIFRRMTGVFLGTCGAFALTLTGSHIALQGLISLAAFAIALRLMRSHPLTSRSLTTAAIILVVFASDDSAVSARLLAELSAAGVLLIVAVVMSQMSRTQDRATQI